MAHQPLILPLPPHPSFPSAPVDICRCSWDPVRNRRATCRMPPLPPHRARHPAYLYPTLEVTRTRIGKLREQHERLERQKARLSALEAELSEAKAEVDLACADARSEALRSDYGADTLRCAREAAKEAYSALLRERKSLLGSVAEGERTVSVYHTIPDQYFHAAVERRDIVVAGGVHVLCIMFYVPCFSSYVFMFQVFMRSCFKCSCSYLCLYSYPCLCFCSCSCLYCCCCCSCSCCCCERCFLNRVVLRGLWWLSFF